MAPNAGATLLKSRQLRLLGYRVVKVPCPKPKTRNPIPETLNPKPEPETLNPKPEPETRNPDLGYRVVKVPYFEWYAARADPAGYLRRKLVGTARQE